MPIRIWQNFSRQSTLQFSFEQKFVTPCFYRFILHNQFNSATLLTFYCWTHVYVVVIIFFNHLCLSIASYATYFERKRAGDNLVFFVWNQTGFSNCFNLGSLRWAGACFKEFQCLNHYSKDVFWQSQELIINWYGRY